MIKKMILKILEIGGYEIHKKDIYDKEKLYNNWEALKINEKKINTCIDIGVGFGTFELYEKFPEAYHILIEPVNGYSKNIEKILTKYRGEWVKKAAGSTNSLSEFHIFEDFPEKSGFLKRKEIAQRKGNSSLEKVEVDRLDNIIQADNYEAIMA
jgi:FkbM family methyltransferase